MLPTLMPDWKMLKSLLRAYAQLDGVVPFRETQPALVSQAAAPLVNAATQAVGDAVTSAPESVQDLAALVTGTGRFVGFSLTGLVDLVGPIAEETPVTALHRISKTILNGLFALTTRAANFGVNGVPGNSRYERGVAATEFGLSVLATVIAAENIIARPRPPSTVLEPLPWMNEFAIANAARAYAPAMGLSVELPKLPPHILLMAGKPRVDDARLAEVLTQHGGNQTHAAKELNMDPSSLSDRIRRSPDGSPLKTFRNQWVSDAELLAALQDAEGCQKTAAKNLGIDPAIISGRVGRAADDSPLARYRRPEVESHQVFAALMRHDGNQSAAARELNLSVSTVNRYAKQFPRVNPHTISDFDMMMALRQYHYTIIETATYLRLWPKDIIARIHDVGSPLSLVLRVTDDGRVKHIVHGERGKLPSSPDAFKAVYFHCGKHIDKVAQFFDVSRMSVYNAIERWGLTEELPIRSRRANGTLVPPRGGKPATVSLDQLAQLYVHHRYNWSAVANGVGRTVAGVFARVSNALASGNESVLKCLIEVQRQMVVAATITDSHIAAVILAHQFDLKRSAAFLAMTPDEVVARVRTFNPQQSPMIERVTPELLK